MEEIGTGRYIVRWDYKEETTTDPETKEVLKTDYATWMVEVLHGNLTKERLLKMFTEYYNGITDEKIIGGYTWKDTPVWLSTENQFNYKAAYDMAVQTDGASLPVTFKFGTSEEPVYYEFATLDDLTIFYTGAMTWVNTCLAEGWQTKDGIDWSVYGVTDNEN